MDPHLLGHRIPIGPFLKKRQINIFFDCLLMFFLFGEREEETSEKKMSSLQ
jgi:hypothetical protein